MTKIKYNDPPKWNKRTKELLTKIIEIVEKYDREGYRMTLRQLYYQLVSHDIIPNQQKEYAKLSRILTEARMAGLVDWDFIEDRIRVPKFPNQFRDIDHAMKVIKNVYRLDRWDDQEYYVECWVEKDALSGVLEPITVDYHVHLLVNRGYSSASAMHDSATRIREQIDQGKKAVILYFGDHDPSGEDMVRDVENRLNNFGCYPEVKKVALTMDQIEQYQPPPNPAKLSDPRANTYIANHGVQSWELDALPPNVLVQLLRDELDELLDREKYDAIIENEDKDKTKMEKFGKRNKGDNEDE